MVLKMVSLKGENQIKKFMKIAEKLVSKISSFDGVVGVIFEGGLARGFADKYSDVDITVFLDRKDERLRKQIRKIGADEQKHSVVDVDLSVHFLEEFAKRRWSEVDRWDYSHAKIVFDPKGEIEKVFSKKLRVPRSFWVRRIVVSAEYLKWYCCPPKKGMDTVAEAWIDRGDLVSVHYCLTYVIDLMLRIIFALNKEFVPSQKWRIFCSYNLKWLPKDYKMLLREAMTVKEMSTNDFERRLKALRRMWRDIAPRIKDATGLTLDMISKYYVEKVLHQK
jgi:predicted nucleotidyltransferase